MPENRLPAAVPADPGPVAVGALRHVGAEPAAHSILDDLARPGRSDPRRRTDPDGQGTIIVAPGDRHGDESASAPTSKRDRP